jgi:hypothetical protein
MRARTVVLSTLLVGASAGVLAFVRTDAAPPARAFVDDPVPTIRRDRPTAPVRARDPSAIADRDAARRRESSGRWSLRRRGPWSPGAAEDPEVAQDVAALAQFDAAFADEERDPMWSAETEARIAAQLASTPDAPALEDVECRRTLCRLELRGPRRALPSGDPFDVAWWIEHDDDAATLLLVRDGAELPLPRDEPS